MPTAMQFSEVLYLKLTKGLIFNIGVVVVGWITRIANLKANITGVVSMGCILKGGFINRTIRKQKRSKAKVCIMDKGVYAGYGRRCLQGR